MKKAFIFILFLTSIICMCGISPAKEESIYANATGNEREEPGASASRDATGPADSKYYTANDYYHMESEGGLHILSHYETCQQTWEYSCGSAATLMVLHYYGIDEYDESEICGLVGTDPETGTTLEGIRDFLESLGFRLDYHADTDLRFPDLMECEEYLIEAIDSGTPVLVEWIDWYGHWQTIIGIDTCETESLFDDVLIMADSMDITDHYQDGYYIVPFARFFCMWRESMFTGKEVPYEQPFITVYGS